MTWVAVLLVGVGLADLVRAGSHPRGRLAAHVVSPVAIAAVAVLAGLTRWPDVVALLAGAAGAAAWVELSERTQADGLRALPALASLAATLAVLVAFSGAASRPDGPLGHWLAWADLPGTTAPGTARVLLLTGLTLFNLATANVIVRLVLLAIGALRPDQVAASARPVPLQPTDPQPSDRLKGGRLLGPMERVVIMGLGLAGELGAAGIVIAAKGLLRFPEIQASGRPTPGQPPNRTGPTGIDDVTEYFLVGSFVSWLVALGSLVLAGR